MKKRSVNNNTEKRVVKYALRRYSIGLVSVAISASLITSMGATTVSASEIIKDINIEEKLLDLDDETIDEIVEENGDNVDTTDLENEVIQTEEVDTYNSEEILNNEVETVSNETDNTTNSNVRNTNAQDVLNQVRSTLAAVTYEELYGILNPIVSGTDRLNIRNELIKELGGALPTEEQVNARVKKVYMEKLDLERNFNNVKDNLDTLLLKVFEKSSYVTAKYVTSRKYQVLLGLTYLDRQYNFSFNGKSAKDIILYDLGNGSSLDYLISIGDLTYSDLEIKNNLNTYSKKLAYITKESNIIDFIEKSIEKYEPSISASDWFKRESKAYIVETRSEYADSSLYNKMKSDTRLKNHLIPLLTLSEDSIYAISTISTVNYGLVDTYVDRLDDTTKDSFKAKLEETAKKQEAFLDFWYRISDKKDKLFEGNDIVIIDTMQKYGTGSAANLWVPESGSKTLSGVREFMTPFNYYSPHMFVDGQADLYGGIVNLFLAKGLTDRGQSVYTHELTHMLDQKVWFNGYGRRTGKGAEVYARGFFESINNTVGNSDYNPIFNLNLTYELGQGRVQNASPSRFETEDDIKEYMQGLMDVIYTLDYAEAKASLEKTADEKAILFNVVELTPDTSSSNVNDVNDTFKNINTDLAGKLNTINDLIDNDVVSGRFAFKGISTTGTATSNGYYVVPLFEPIYAAVQNDAGSVGDITFRRYAYELLAEYGYKNGMVAYVSDQYANDEEALKAILDTKYNGSLAEFKKDMFARRIDKLSLLKGTDYFANYDELQELMNEAVDKDLARMKDNKKYNIAMTTGVTEVNALKTKIFQWYLNNTNDFESSIYKNPVVVSQEVEVTETEIPISTIYKTDDTLWEDETRTELGKAGVIKTTKVWRTEDGVRVGDPVVTTETIDMKPTIVYKGTKKIDGEIVTVKDNVKIDIVTKIVEDPNMYEDEIREVIGEAGIKKVTTVQRTEKGNPVGDPIITEEIVKEMKPTIVYRGTKKIAGEIVTVKDNVEIAITTKVVEDPNLYEGEIREVLGEAGIKKVTIVQKTEKGNPVGDPIITEEIIKEMKQTIIYKGTKGLSLQDKEYSISLAEDTLVFNNNLTDNISAILDNIIVGDKLTNVSKQIIGDIPTTYGKHRIRVRVSYGDGIYYDIEVPIIVEAIKDDSNNSTGGNNDNSNNSTDNNNNNNNSNGQTGELNKPNKDESINVLPNNSGVNIEEVENTDVSKTADNNIPLYSAITGLITSSLVLLFTSKKRKKDNN